MKLLLVLIAVLLSGLVAVVPAAETSAALLAVDSAFVNGEYAASELLALRALQDETLSHDARARLNLLAGYSLIMLGRESEARVYFAHALEAVPDLELDPVQVSPRFRMVFDEVKAGRKPAEVPTVRTHRALLWNLLLPGSGQWLEGRPTRGALIFTAQLAAGAVFVWQLGELGDSRADYLAESDPARLTPAYDRYDDHHRLAIGLGALAGVVYLAAQTDLIFMRPPMAAAPQVLLAPGTDGHSLALALRW